MAAATVYNVGDAPTSRWVGARYDCAPCRLSFVLVCSKAGFASHWGFPLSVATAVAPTSRCQPSKGSWSTRSSLPGARAREELPGGHGVAASKLSRRGAPTRAGAHHC